MRGLGGGGGGGGKSLEQTPAWAVATVATVFVVVSLLLERGISCLGRKLEREKQKPLLHTLEKIKEELMLLGFISLLLTVFQSVVASLCMPERLSRTMLPCKYIEQPLAADTAGAPMAQVGEGFNDSRTIHARRLFQATTDQTTPGKVQVISVEGLHQLHIFIFVMAVVHVFYSCITVLLGFYKMHSWRKWEEETHKEKLNSIGAGHITYIYVCTLSLHIVAHIMQVSFFRQFGISVTKEDYNCLRLGFIANHKLGMTYNFHGYIQRTMEDDFKVVVGISGYLWAFVVIFLLLNVDGWYTYFWIAFIPFILILLVGTKLQQIITDMALEVRALRVVKPTENMPLEEVNGTINVVKNPDDPQGQELIHKLVRPRDDLFWFNRPQLLLYLIHFILFQNAFELAFFFWLLKTFGFTSCIMGKAWVVISRLVIGVFVQILCSYSTLPLYALVTQMGSQIKHSIFQESTELAIHGWHEKVKEKRKKRKLSHRPVSSSIHKTFGLSSKLKHHNSTSHSTNEAGEMEEEEQEEDQKEIQDDGAEGTLEEQMEFVEELEHFFKQRNMEYKPPKFYGLELNVLKLWRVVTRLGGHDHVTASKLWRTVGEEFKPPKTCTTISWSFRGFYEKALLDYERYKTGVPGTGNIQRPGHMDSSFLQMDSQGTGSPTTPTAQVSAGGLSGSGRARRDSAARAMQGWHSQRTGNGETKDTNGRPRLREQSPPINSAGANTGKRSLKQESARRPVMAKQSDGIVTAFEPPIVDEGPKADWVKINVHKHVDCFEIYALVPGLAREEVRIQCEPGGRLVIAGMPEDPDNPWGVTPFRKVISLPSRIDAHQTSAVVTLYGQLYVRVPIAESKSS
ncbi:unnamed protein product [Sphagnum tenellum]